MEDLAPIIESLLFVSDNPLTVERIRAVLPQADTRRIRETLSGLAAEYERRGGGFYLREVADGYQLRSRPEYQEWIKRLVQTRPQRLSAAALETLAIIAYKQPVIRSDIEHIRGVDCGGVLRMLLERKLVRILGRREIPGRPIIYATTRQFLEIFDLKNLKELPTPKEIEELGRQADLAQGDEPAGSAASGEDPDSLHPPAKPYAEQMPAANEESSTAGESEALGTQADPDPSDEQTGAAISGEDSELLHSPTEPQSDQTPAATEEPPENDGNSHDL